MENFDVHKDREGFFLRHSPRSSLLRTVYNLLLSCVSALPLLMTMKSCTEKTVVIEEKTGSPAVAFDSTDMVIDISVDEKILDGRSADIGRIDIFIYEGAGTRQLEKHLEMDGPGSIRTKCRNGDKILVAIANSKASFNLTALQKYDTMELLRYRAEDDDPERPLMSAATEIALQDKGGGTVRTGLVLEPLMCIVRVTEIVNEIGGYTRLESPRLGLYDRSPDAEVLRKDGFRPVEVLRDTLWTELPHDIGIFPLEAGTELWCYPNDTPEETLGTPRTGIVLECRIGGVKHLFNSGLPPLGRGGTTEAAITVRGTDECSYRFF